MTYRPKYTTRPDDNHKIVIDYLRDACGGYQSFKSGNTNGYSASRRGYTVFAIDTSKVGGLLPDWLIGASTFDHARSQIALCEVKTPEAYKTKDHDLTDGEKITQTLCGFYIVTNDDEVAAMFDDILGKLEA